MTNNARPMEGEGIRLVKQPLMEEMEVFDALPPAFREKLKSMSVLWNAVGVKKIIDQHGEDCAMATLEKVENDMQAAYLARLPERLAA